MRLRTLHSDRSAPEEVLASYRCPECGSERRLPLAIGPAGIERPMVSERSTSLGTL
jgi:hypothetical protein